MPSQGNGGGESLRVHKYLMSAARVSSFRMPLKFMERPGTARSVLVR